MKLDTEPFNQIKNGLKKIEYRLYDEKRKKLKIGDIIEFQKLPNLNEKIKILEFDLENTLYKCTEFKCEKTGI